MFRSRNCKIEIDLTDPGKDKEIGVDDAVLKSAYLNNDSGRFRD